MDSVAVIEVLASRMASVSPASPGQDSGWFRCSQSLIVCPVCFEAPACDALVVSVVSVGECAPDAPVRAVFVELG